MMGRVQSAGDDMHNKKKNTLRPGPALPPKKRRTYRPS